MRNVLIEAVKILYSDYLKYRESNPQRENASYKLKIKNRSEKEKN